MTEERTLFYVTCKGYPTFFALDIPDSAAYALNE